MNTWLSEDCALIEDKLMHDLCVFSGERASQQRLIKLSLHETYLYGDHSMTSC